MPRTKRREEFEASSMNRYLRRKKEGEDETQHSPETKTLIICDLKGFLIIELKNIGTELKDLKADFKGLDTRLLSTEGNRKEVGTAVGHLPR